MAEKITFYDREAVSPVELARIRNLASAFYGEYGENSKVVLEQLEQENPEAFASDGMATPKTRSVFAAELSILPVVERLEQNTGKENSDTDREVRMVYEKLLALDESRGFHDMDIRLSDRFIDQAIASDNEIVSDAAFEIMVEEHEAYVEKLKERQKQGRIDLVNVHVTNINSINNKINSGYKPADKFGSFYEQFSENETLCNAMDNWLDIYQMENGCSRDEAKEALAITAEEYSENDSINITDMIEHFDTDACMRFGNIVENTPYKDYQRIMEDPDMVSFDEHFRSAFPEHSKNVYDQRRFADADAKKRLKKASVRYSIAAQATADLMNKLEGAGIDLDR